MKRFLSLTIAASLWLAPALHASNQLQIKTDKGKVEGSLTTDGKVRAFKGIPYAAPPVGNLRWQAPQPAAKWKGVRQAKEFGNHCFQTNVYPDMIFHESGESEDLPDAECVDVGGSESRQPAGDGLDLWRRVRERRHL